MADRFLTSAADVFVRLLFWLSFAYANWQTKHNNESEKEQ